MLWEFYLLFHRDNMCFLFEGEYYTFCLSLRGWDNCNTVKFTRKSFKKEIDSSFPTWCKFKFWALETDKLLKTSTFLDLLSFHYLLEERASAWNSASWYDRPFITGDGKDECTFVVS